MLNFYWYIWCELIWHQSFKLYGKTFVWFISHTYFQSSHIMRNMSGHTIINFDLSCKQHWLKTTLHRSNCLFMCVFSVNLYSWIKYSSWKDSDALGYGNWPTSTWNDLQRRTAYHSEGGILLCLLQSFLQWCVSALCYTFHWNLFW